MMIAEKLTVSIPCNPHQGDLIFDTTKLQGSINLPNVLLLPYLTAAVEGKIKPEVDAWAAVNGELQKMAAPATPDPNDGTTRHPVSMLFQFLEQTAV